MADDGAELGRLVFLFSFLSIALGTTVSPIELCGAPNYDVWNLTSKMWKFSSPKEFCLMPRTENTTVDACEITMAFCQPVNIPLNCANAAVCESYSSSNDTFNLATYVNNPFNTTALPMGEGFGTNYGSGEIYNTTNTTCTLRTVMTFVCNASASWDISQKNEPFLSVPVKPSINFTQGPKLCTYSIKFDFAGACPVSPPGGPVSQLSAGSVLLLIFFVSLIMYFVLGCFINIVRGKVGQDIIPHQTFWTALPVYIMDGIQFALTCGEKRTSSSYQSI
ncbi:uncharacterized protein [Littorina saxatilis]|uniref:Autophagy-related protein 27 n=1 Tax=Littorina saxatilis TaxID=31220 RepID=A0AAN9C3Y4_9CAEN